MDSTLKELIQKATIDGNITEANRKYIQELAIKKGVSEIEVNIYIEASLKDNSSKSEVNKININPIDFKKISWIDILSYLFGFGIILSGFFPWVEAYGSSNLGGNFNMQAGSGIGLIYSFPLGIGALFFANNLKLRNYRIYYGLGVIIISLLFVFSYHSSSSFSGGGYSGSAGTKAGLGVLVLLIMGLSYTVVNLLNVVKIIIEKKTNMKIQFTSELKTSLISSLLIITILSISIFFNINDYWYYKGYPEWYYILIILIIGCILFKNKLKLNKIYFALLTVILLDSTLNFFEIYEKIGDVSFNNLNGEIIYGLGRFGDVLDNSFKDFMKIIEYIYKSLVYASAILIIYGLFEITQAFFKTKLLSNVYTILNQHYKKLIWIILFLFTLNISLCSYIAIKNRNDKNNSELNKNKLDDFNLFGQWTKDIKTCGDEVASQGNLFIEIDKDNQRTKELGIVDQNSSQVNYTIGSMEWSGLIKKNNNNSFDLYGFDEGEKFICSYTFTLKEDEISIQFIKGDYDIIGEGQYFRCK